MHPRPRVLVLAACILGTACGEEAPAPASASATATASAAWAPGQPVSVAVAHATIVNVWRAPCVGPCMAGAARWRDVAKRLPEGAEVVNFVQGPIDADVVAFAEAHGLQRDLRPDPDSTKVLRANSTQTVVLAPFNTFVINNAGVSVWEQKQEGAFDLDGLKAAWAVFAREHPLPAATAIVIPKSNPGWLGWERADAATAIRVLPGEPRFATEAMFSRSLANAYASLGQKDEARAALARYRELAPDANDVDVVLAFIESGVAPAKAVATGYVAAPVPSSLTPSEAASFTKAQALLLAGDAAGALVLLEGLAAKYPAEAQLQRNLGVGYARARDNGKAAAAYGRYLELAPDAEDAPKVRALLNTR